MDNIEEREFKSFFKDLSELTFNMTTDGSILGFMIQKKKRKKPIYIDLIIKI